MDAIGYIVWWTEYTAVLNGRVVKRVPCENCQAEYVYILEREGTGIGTSLYWLNEEGAENNAVSSADTLLQEYLANDFDPIPCPSCGHYQKYMFPKLIETRSRMGLVATIATLLIGGFSALTALYWGIESIKQPNETN